MGILFFAITTVGFAGKDDHPANDSAGIVDATGSEVSNADLAVLRNFIGG